VIKANGDTLSKVTSRVFNMHSFLSWTSFSVKTVHNVLEILWYSLKTFYMFLT